MDSQVLQIKTINQAVKVAGANKILKSQAKFMKESCLLTNTKTKKKFHINSHRIIM